MGVGTTNPLATLHINSVNPQLLLSNGTTHGEINFGNTSYGVGRNTVFTNFTDTNDVVLYTVDSGGSGLKTQNGFLKVASNGNVGIGTNNPTEKLNIYNGNLLFNGTWASGTEYNIQCINQSKQIKWSYDNGTHIIDNNAIIFEVDYSERMKITNTGNVGIGITNPSYDLDVVGNINLTGNLTLNGVDYDSDTSNYI